MLKKRGGFKMKEKYANHFKHIYEGLKAVQIAALRDKKSENKF